ncbi:MAG TPA: arginine--tRNA ligase [Vicinamibacterales bacterium]|nr:arginine--tRNA ligase [Vicinamibacterales bacterium]
MLLPVAREIRDHVGATIRRLYPAAEPPDIAVEMPPNRALGDLAVAVAFQLARPLRKAPRAIAQEIAAALGPVPGVARVEAAPNGYLNCFLDRPAFLLAQLAAPPAPQAGLKTIVEHTAINPNKAAHIGHLRNAALGDTLVRALRFSGVPVEVQNYIDDTGVQVADVVVGFRELERLTLADVRQIADTTRFDYYCWDLYARVTAWYAEDPARLAVRAAALHDIEQGGTDTAAMAAFVADRIVRRHLETMARLNVDYDLLTWEGDILRLHFWSRAFEILKAQGTVFLQTAGRLAGCWVMRIEDDAPAAGDADAAAGDGGDEEADQREKVIVRSNGTVTYVGKDIAYQFWKFGRLGVDFRYRIFTRRADGRPLWSTTAEAAAAEAGAPAFGRASRIYNVIDVRQSYLQALLSQALRAMGHAEEAENSIHFSYEMVALSHATARELGHTVSAEEGRKPFVEVSGRRGLGVKADDLLDTLIGKAAEEVARRNPDCAPSDRDAIATAIGVAAVRYFMVKFSRGKVIAFDIDEALNFEGESGPYLQYAVVRANNIFHKLRDRDGLEEADLLAGLDRVPAPELLGEDGSHDLWALVLEAGRLDEVVDQVIRSLEFSVLAKYAFGLAQMFNAFYHRYPILNEDRPDIRRWRAAGVACFRAQLARALDLMGITVPSRM